MRVMHLISGFRVGGAERNLLNIISNQHAADVQYCIACRRDSDPLYADFQQTGVPIHVLQSGKYAMYNPLRLGEINELAGLVKKLKIDVLHAHMPPSILYGPFAARKAGIVSVASMHAMRSQLSALQFIQAPLMQSRIDYFVEGSNGVSTDLVKSGISPEKLVAIPYGVDAQKFRSNDQEARAAFRARFGIDKSSFVIGRIARFHADKGFDLFLKMVPALSKIIPNLKVVLVGDGDQRAALESQVQALNLNEIVVFTGFFGKTEQALAAFDLVAITARAEALGISTLEAMAAAKCFVAYATGGLTEGIHDGYNGLCISPGNQAGFIQAVTQLYQQTEQRRSMELNSRDLFEQKFSVQVMCQSLENFYQKLVCTGDYAKKDSAIR